MTHALAAGQTVSAVCHAAGHRMWKIEETRSRRGSLRMCVCVCEADKVLGLFFFARVFTYTQVKSASRWCLRCVSCKGLEPLCVRVRKECEVCKAQSHAPAAKT